MQNKKPSFKGRLNSTVYRKTLANCYVEFSQDTLLKVKKFYLPPKPKLDGLKFSVKDCFDYKGRIQTFGIQRWKQTHSEPFTTASAISKLESSGAHLDGFVKCDQLSYSLIGNVFSAPTTLEKEISQPLNPIYPDRVCGGSSSGSAVSVGNKIVDFSLAVDTAGSIRVPASSCGIVGIRPTQNLISNNGCIPLSKSFDCVGLLSNSIETLEKVLPIISKIIIPNHNVIKKILIPSDSYSILDDDLAETTIEYCENLSKYHDIPTQDIIFEDFTSKETAELFTRIQSRDIWEAHGKWVEENHDFIDKEVLSRLNNCKKIYSESSKEDIKNDHSKRLNLRAKLLSIMEYDNVIALPSIPALPPLLSASSNQLRSFRKNCLRLCSISSLSGTPQIIIPSYSERTDNIYGIGFISAPLNDGKLIRLLSI